ncbi:MAG: hypothetical protein K2F64_06780, partial [Muribaculaceae bacterium]|nr:hypothetical protein [Muribaculaceae bacterium]
MKKLQGMERAYTKESLLPNSSEWHLAEHPSDVPDLLPTQGKSEISERKVSDSASDKQESGAESSVQTADSKGERSIQGAVEAASSEVNTDPTPAQVESTPAYVVIETYPTYDVEQRRDSDGTEYYAIRLKKGFKDRAVWKAIAEKHDCIYSGAEGRGVFMFYKGREAMDAFLREVSADERDTGEENPRFDMDNVEGNRKASAEAFEVAKGMLESAGIDVVEVSDAEA